MLPLLHTNSPYTLSGEQLERNHTVGRYAILEAAVGRTLLRRMAGGLAAEFFILPFFTGVSLPNSDHFML